ncbi:hypothetical protein GGC65_002331 [Sphingopyxis sp. OAS728]|uniref:hypothetical protein n=1 Tax=Sphingopyxis sp. OAS728 TaxID=2663823 RepID=UPI00178A76F3|nr:hypothetical protein [Sphingopyxis sp. OAS728]MBE1527875.1 hypothetical protein [Sphingopyxis sp. OAS728]
MSQLIRRTERESDMQCSASPWPVDQAAERHNPEGLRGAATGGSWAGRRFLSARIVHLLRPATKQIFARPADPLSVALSYEILRNGIGVLALAFPIVMLVGGGLGDIQSSLSAYYHFSPAAPTQYGAGTMRDAFVGMLCAIGSFLFFYRGHSLQEDLALNAAGISVVLVAFMPMDWPAAATSSTSIAGTIHWVSATVFFVMIAYVCIFRARDTLCLTCDAARRRTFERIYLVLGSLMFLTPAAAAISFDRSGYATLIIEICGIIVFSSFWLVKGYEIRSSLRRTIDAD